MFHGQIFALAETIRNIYVRQPRHLKSGLRPVFIHQSTLVVDELFDPAYV